MRQDVKGVLCVFVAKLYISVQSCSALRLDLADSRNTKFQNFNDGGECDLQGAVQHLPPVPQPGHPLNGLPRDELLHHLPLPAGPEQRQGGNLEVGD